MRAPGRPSARRRSDASGMSRVTKTRVSSTPHSIVRTLLGLAMLGGAGGADMENLSDRVAVVTGGASGIGAGIARACAEQGMRVVVADIELAPAQKIARELEAA